MKNRAEHAWPGQDGDQQTRHGIASLSGRPPRLERVDASPGMPAAPAPIDADWQEIPTGDGGVIIRMGGTELLNDDETDDSPTYNEDFYRNLAESMDDGDLASVAEELLEGIEADIQSRMVWMGNYERGMSILGIEMKQPRAEATGEGVSQVDHPLLLEATILYQSNACAEELPASGPVKIDNGGQSTAITDEDAQQLEKDFNKYLTVHRPEYYPDTERMIYQRGFGGMGFKKIFHCPIRRAPVSDTVEPGDLIVSNTATSLENCGRKTHRIKIRPSVMKRMQFVGAYRDVDLQTPTDNISGIERKTKQIAGIKPTTDRQQDTDFTVYECCCELDLIGDRHTERGKATGLPRPYIVSIERDSRQVLEIRRNWIEEDELFSERRRFIASSFLPMFGFYATGLLGVLGNSNSALTAGWRIMCDKGMFSNFPGGMYAKNGDRQLDNNFRAAPGEFVPVDISGFDDIRKVVAPYPYTEPGVASQQFFAGIETTAQRVGGSASIPVAEGKADTPVGTMLAALEQTSKMISAVHRRAHTAQSLEFATLLELIREKPEDFVKYFQADGFWSVDRLKRALDNWSLIPRADPNTPTQMHRLLKMMALKQLQQLSPPPAAPGAMPPDPTLAVAGIVAQTEQAKVASKEKIELGKGQLKLVEMQGKQQTEAQKLEIARQKIETDARLKREAEEAATERELLKIHAAAGTQQADQQHQAGMGGMQQQHQSAESAADREHAVEIAKMKPKPAPSGGKPKA
jgi:hypothetical protein